LYFAASPIFHQLIKFDLFHFDDSPIPIPKTKLGYKILLSDIFTQSQQVTKKVAGSLLSDGQPPGRYPNGPFNRQKSTGHLDGC
jgi:hypothetical protein